MYLRAQVFSLAAVKSACARLENGGPNVPMVVQALHDNLLDGHRGVMNRRAYGCAEDCVVR